VSCVPLQKYPLFPGVDLACSIDHSAQRRLAMTILFSAPVYHMPKYLYPSALRKLLYLRCKSNLPGVGLPFCHISLCMYVCLCPSLATASIGLHASRELVFLLAHNSSSHSRSPLLFCWALILQVHMGKIITLG